VPTITGRAGETQSRFAASGRSRRCRTAYIWVQRLGTSPVPVRSASTADGPLTQLGRCNAVDFTRIPTLSAPSGRMGRRLRVSVHPTNGRPSSLNYRGSGGI
jgi:hypothetical protein